MSPKFSDDKSSTGHIFREAEGHFTSDTPANREQLLNTVKPENLHGIDNFGNKWYSQISPNEQQTWVSVRPNGVVQNADFNQVPRVSFDPNIGLIK